MDEDSCMVDSTHSLTVADLRHEPLVCCICLMLRAIRQVLEVCRAANPRLVIKRARFSALVYNDLTRAVQNLVAPDRFASEAVDARQEIDLRIGASFTRFQTLLLQVLQPNLAPICHSWRASAIPLCFILRMAGWHVPWLTQAILRAHRISSTGWQRGWMRVRSSAMGHANFQRWGLLFSGPGALRSHVTNRRLHMGSMLCQAHAAIA